MPELVHLRPFAVCHAQVIAIQKSEEDAIRQRLRPDALNVFLSKDRFVVLTFAKKKWWRTQYTQFPPEFVGLNARFFTPYYAQ
jgi:hypothetical protein